MLMNSMFCNMQKSAKIVLNPPHSKGEYLKTLHFLPKNGVLQGCPRYRAEDPVA